MTALAHVKRDVSHLHVIVLGLFGIKADADVLPNMPFWRVLKMGAAKGERLPGLRVWPHRFERPPTAHGGGFYTYICDGSRHVPVQSPGYSTYDEDDQADQAYEADT